MDRTSTDDLDSRFAANRGRINIALSQFTIPLLLRTYKFFEGDFVAVIVLGEIAHRNIEQWLDNTENREADLEDPAVRADALRPCNALSISEVCGIPRETVRRKVKDLIERGWVTRDAKGHLFLVPGMSADFDQLTLGTVKAFLKTADGLRALLGQSEPNGALHRSMCNGETQGKQATPRR